MSTSMFLGLLVVGGAIGVLGGMLGIGGGLMVIPALMFLFGFSYTQAIGTSLGMLLPPIGIFAFLAYWRAGPVDLRVATLLAMGFMLGAWLGSWLVTQGAVPEMLLSRVFALFLLYVAGSMLFKSESRVWAALGSLATVAAFAAAYGVLAMLGRRWDARWSLQAVYSARRRRAPRPDYEI